MHYGMELLLCKFESTCNWVCTSSFDKNNHVGLRKAILCKRCLYIMHHAHYVSPGMSFRLAFGVTKPWPSDWLFAVKKPQPSTTGVLKKAHPHGRWRDAHISIDKQVSNYEAWLLGRTGLLETHEKREKHFTL
jgi:hypothetical protein